jgi:hypothetical protein
VLLEEKAAEIKANSSEIGVAAESFLIRAESFVGLIGFVMRQTEVVPGLSILRQELSGKLELGDRLRILSSAQEAFALQ